LRSFIDTTKRTIFLYGQMLVVVAAFSLMGVSSFLFVSDIERKHLVRDALDILTSTEAEITAHFLEPETFLSSYSETIRSMILYGDTSEKIKTYMVYMTQYMFDDEEHMKGFKGTYGYIEKENIYISGLDWDIGTNFIVQERLWYTAAVNAKGKVAMTEPYVDARTGNVVITFTRQMIDDEGHPLGIICLDMDIYQISQYAVNINLTKNSYGILLDNNLVVVAHPNIFYQGIPLINQRSGLSVLADELKHGNDVFERRVRNYKNEDTIVFFRQIKYGWYLGVITPNTEYFKNLNNMALFLVILGTILTAALCYILYSISTAKKKSDIKTHQKSSFLATMSHEIRTPLNTIMGVTEIELQNNVHTIETLDAFTKIYNSGDLLLSIINDILDLSKIEAGRLDLMPVKYEVASLIYDIVQLNAIRYESKPIEFKLIIDENIPLSLEGDELRIKQILNNLLSNAFKYTERGTVTLSANAEYIGKGGAVHVALVFTISDTGPGMTSEQVHKLFDEYTRFNLDANRTTEGTGLGMSITRRLLDLMYGKISVKSEVGKGTTITVRIPHKMEIGGIHGVLGKELVENLQRFSIGDSLKIKKTQITYEFMPYGRVLIVDDVETNLYVARGLMSPYGLSIDVAVSGFEAIDKIKNGSIYDVVFMDHMMPNMDGIEAVKIIREMGYTFPIVALTANALTGRAEMFLNNGFDDFISKPVDIRQLNVALKKFIYDKQPPEVIQKAKQQKAEQEKYTASKNQVSVGSQLAEIFARDAEKAASVLEAAHKNKFLGDGDVQMFIINIHAMKSALANIGEPGLSASAQKLEQAGRDRKIKEMILETPVFLNSLRAVIEKIKPKDDESETDYDLSEDEKIILHEKLLIIQKACIDYDKKTAKNTLNELKEKALPRETKDLLNEIAERILHSEFDEAASLADEYLKN
jgi:signal transduction histidine kinase/DNA-binding response OmpR family regulator